MSGFEIIFHSKTLIIYTVAYNFNYYRRILNILKTKTITFIYKSEFKKKPLQLYLLLQLKKTAFKNNKTLNAASKMYENVKYKPRILFLRNRKLKDSVTI